MNSSSTYLTLKHQSEGLYKEKGSKFIGIAVPCYNEEDAKSFLEGWRQEHHQARHVCYAYRFGVKKEVYRANDDGEPNNSAGAPILGQIESYDLTNILIGVVRYYGGTKLGVGGLINAYRTAAKEAIENGEIVELELFYWAHLSFDYVDMPQVMNVLKKANIDIEAKSFEVACEVVVKISLDGVDTLKEELGKFESLNWIKKGIY